VPFHIAAWQQAVDPAGAFVALNAVADPVLTVAGANIQVPSLNRIVALAAGVEQAVAQQARLSAPSRRVLALQRITPVQGNAAAASLPASPHRLIDLADTPLQMVTGEQASIEINSNPAAVQVQWGLAWFADDALKPTQGNYFTVRADAAQLLVANAWTNAAIVFAENLPRGRYRVVGMRAQSAGLVAARLVFVGTGSQGPWRPGVMGCISDSHLEYPGFRYGQWGPFGEFEDTDTPTVDFLSATADAAEVVYLDLEQMRAGPA
jgi:hypothetical protein